MKNLNFQTTRKTYKVNDNAEISFDPADIGFANRLFTLMDKLEKRQNEPAPENQEDVFVVAEKRDAEMRAEIDAVFDEPVCDKVFGRTNVFSPAGGLPLCVNFLMAIIKEVEEAAHESTKTSPAAAALLKEFEEKYGKK